MGFGWLKAKARSLEPARAESPKPKAFVLLLALEQPGERLQRFFEQRAVPPALVRHFLALAQVGFEVAERCVGALMMHFVLETILAARLLGVDPFDQPAVELAKVITRERVAALP